MSLEQKSLEMHKKSKGKIEVNSKVPLNNREDLSIYYTPGVAEVSRAIHKERSKIYEYTSKWNTIAVVSDGSAILGLGNLGPEAALPVMEGKAILFKQFGGVDAFPICISSQETEKIVETVKQISLVFGGINLEDIAAPRCFEVEERLKKEIDIPVFHDDQHGTAIVVLGGLMNALKLVGKKFGEVKVAISGAGAAGIAVAKVLLANKVKDVILCDSKGPIYGGRKEGMNNFKEQIAKVTNKSKVDGSLANALKGADVFIGVSGPNLANESMVKSMASNPIIFSMANPDPEIRPELARKAGAKIIATGRSDLPNQINNVLAFPGVFRGALDVRASDINEEMKGAAAMAIAALVSEKELREDYIIPSPFDNRVAKSVAQAVSEAARKTKVARI